MSDQYEGVIDNIAEAFRWRPLMPMLIAARTETDTARKLKAIEIALAFTIRTLFDVDPDSNKAFRAFSLVVDLAATDKRVRALIEELGK